MRGQAAAQKTLLIVGSVEERIPQRHPIRRIKARADEALASMGGVFEAMYAKIDRPSVPPERLLKAQLLMALYSVRSDRQFCEQLEYNLLFRWFLDLQLDEPSFDPSTFSHKRKRLIEHDAAQHLLAAVVGQARGRHLLSDEHFSVDGTLIEAWASMKSFRPKDGPPPDDTNGWSDFRGQKRSNETHASTTDPEAKLFRKGNGREAKLSYCGNVLMENRTGLLVDVDITLADGYGEREGAARMLGRQPRKRRTLGADKGYDTRGFVATCRELGVTPHVARNVNARRSSAIDGRTTRHPGYAASQKMRRRVGPPVHSATPRRDTETPTTPLQQPQTGLFVELLRRPSRSSVAIRLIGARSSATGVRFPRGLVQPAPAALGARLLQAARAPTAAAGGGGGGDAGCHPSRGLALLADAPSASPAHPAGVTEVTISSA